MFIGGDQLILYCQPVAKCFSTPHTATHIDTVESAINTTQIYLARHLPQILTPSNYA